MTIYWKYITIIGKKILSVVGKCILDETFDQISEPIQYIYNDLFRYENEILSRRDLLDKIKKLEESNEFLCKKHYKFLNMARQVRGATDNFLWDTGLLDHV